MNIGIFETQHFEGAYPMIRILDMPGISLTIYVNGDTYSRFNDLFGKDMARYTWVVKAEHVSNRRFVWQIYKTCRKNKTKFLFLNTITANFALYAWVAAFLPSVKVILTLHDANSFLKSRYTLNVRQSIRHTGKRMLAMFCYAYSTVSETVQQHLQSAMQLKKKIYCIPGAVFENDNITPSSYIPPCSLRIVIAGSIDNRRRDYEQVFEFLTIAAKQLLEVVIIVAGGPYGAYGTAILDRFREYSKNKSNIIYYETPVLHQELFDHALNNAHFVWIPSVINTVIEDNIPETYGLTKSSGNIFDAIKHAKPLLIPEGLAIPAQLLSSSFGYSTVEELVIFLKKISHSPNTYQALANEAINNSLGYTTEKMRVRIKELLCPVIP